MVEVGAIVKGKVTGIQSFGAFVAIDGENTQGLIHISEVNNSYVQDINEFLQVGQEVEVKVINIDTERNKISLSIRALMPNPEGSSKKREPRRDKDGEGNRAPRPRKTGDKKRPQASVSYIDNEEGSFNSLGDKLNAALNK